jgi:hypothetical protein
MHALALRATVIALSAALLFSVGDVVLAQSDPALKTTEDQGFLPYTQAGQLIDVGGRHFNMHCAGSGSPTVILMAGLFS